MFPDENTSGGIFVLSNVEMPRSELPFNVFEDVVLRDASTEEIRLLERALEDTYGIFGSPLAEATLKYKGHVITNEKGGQTLTEKGYEGQPRFWVVAYHGVNDRTPDLELAGLLTEPQLALGFAYMCRKPKQADCTGCLIGSRTPISRFRSDLFDSPKTMPVQELERFRDIYRALRVKDSVPPGVRHAMERYVETFRFDWSDEVLVLLYAGLIESIITHKPDSKDPTDSLTRQVKAKMRLVANRFEQTVTPESYFTSKKAQLGDFKKMWADLYSIRSDIVHGNHDSLKISLDKKFGTLACINKYLHDCIRELIKVYLREPELIRDLKDC